MSFTEPESHFFPKLCNPTFFIPTQQSNPRATCYTDLSDVPSAAVRLGAFPSPITNGLTTVEVSGFERNYGDSDSLPTAHRLESKSEELFIALWPTEFSPSGMDNNLVSSPLSSVPQLPDPVQTPVDGVLVVPLAAMPNGHESLNTLTQFSPHSNTHPINSSDYKRWGTPELDHRYDIEGEAQNPLWSL